MKKVVILVSTVLLFAGLTFGQTTTQDKAKPAATKSEAPAKKDAKCDSKKDAKGCEKTCTHKEKSCCAKKGDGKTEVKSTTPEKK